MPGGGSRKSSAINGSLSSAVRVSKRRLLPESGVRERRRCHNVVTTRCEPGESTGDAKIRFLLVILRRELLRDNEMRPMSDWGSSGRRFKSCQPDHVMSHDIGIVPNLL